jgi:hypothetical protein
LTLKEIVLHNGNLRLEAKLQLVFMSWARGTICSKI